jgi:integrase
MIRDCTSQILGSDKGELSRVDGSIVSAPTTDLVALARDVQGFVAGKRSEATRAAYAKDWRTFGEWMACPACPVPERLPRPLGLEVYAAELRESVRPEVVALWVAELVRRGRKLKTIERSVAAITVVHQLADLESPTHDRLVRDTLAGVRRELARLGRAAPAKKAPLMTEIVVAIVRELDVSTLAGQRDAALVTFGVASMLRREEIARVVVEHLRLVEKGAEVLIPWSKTDQEGEAETIPVSLGSTPHTCPVRTVQRWLASASIEAGPVFRRVDRHDRVGGPLSPRAVAEIVKRCVRLVGLDARDFAGHSMRAGGTSSAARARKTMASIAVVTRHKDLRTLAGYIRRATLFDDAANEGFGL